MAIGTGTTRRYEDDRSSTGHQAFSRRAPRDRQGGAQGRPAGRARGDGARQGAPRSAGAAPRPGQGPRAGPRADPLRSHVGLAVHLLPRVGGRHGLRSGAGAAQRPHRAALRRRAPLQLRRLRFARAHAAVRPQRLRRDAAGPVRVGRQAPRGEPRRRGTRQRLRRLRVPRRRARRRALVSRARARVRRRCATSRSGTRASRPTTSWLSCARRATSRRSPRRRRQGDDGGGQRRRRAAKAAGRRRTPDARGDGRRAEKILAKTRSRDNLQAFAKLTEVVDGARRIREDPPLLVRIDAQRGRHAGHRAQGVRRLQEHARGRPPRAGRPLRVRRHGAQGRRCRQRRDALPDRPHEGSRRRRSPLPAAQAGGTVGARDASRALGVPQRRPSRRRRPAADAGSERHLPRLDPRYRGGAPRLLLAPAARHEGLGRRSLPQAARAGRLRRALRLVHGARPRAQRRPHRDRLVPGRRRPLRPCHGRLRRGLRRSRRGATTPA